MRLGQDSRAYEGRQGLGGHQFDGPAQVRFEQLGKRKETSVGLGTWCELNDEIDIARGMGLASENRPKERQSDHAQRANVLLAAREARDRLVSAENWR